MERGISALCSVCLILFAPALHAGGGGIAGGGATEVTQLANKAQLIAQAKEAVKTAANTLETAKTTMQMLKSLPDSILNEAFSGLPIDQVKAMADAYDVFNGSIKVYQDAEDVLNKALHDSQRLNIPPSELLRYKAEAAARYGGVYRSAYEAEQARLARLATTSKEVEKQANMIKGINSQVGGMQAIASQNVQIQTTLAEISTSISQANAIAMRRAEMEQEAIRRSAERERKTIDEVKKRQDDAKSDVDKLSVKGIGPFD